MKKMFTVIAVGVSMAFLGSVVDKKFGISFQGVSELGKIAHLAVYFLGGLFMGFVFSHLDKKS